MNKKQKTMMALVGVGAVATSVALATRKAASSTGYTLTFTIIDSVTGAPVPGAAVSFQFQDVSGITDVNGQVTFEDVTPDEPDTGWLGGYVTANGYLDASWGGTLLPGINETTVKLIHL